MTQLPEELVWSIYNSKTIEIMDNKERRICEMKNTPENRDIAAAMVTRWNLCQKIKDAVELKLI